MKKLIFACIFISLPLVSSAKINRNSTKPVVFPEKPEPTGITEKDVEKIIPLDLNVNDQASIPARLVDRSFQAWFDSPQIQASLLGRTANTVQKSLKTDVTLKPAEPTGVEHKFSFQLLAAQTMAKVQYAGWLNAAFNYDAHAASSMLELSEKIFKTDLFLNLKRNSTENLSSVGLKWDW